MSGLETYIQGILKSDKIQDMVLALMDVSVVIAFGAVALFFAVNLMLTYIKAYSDGGHLSWDALRPEIIRSTIVLALLSSYMPVTALIDNVFMSIYNDYKLETSDEKLEKYVEKRLNMTAQLESIRESGKLPEPESLDVLEVVTDPVATLSGSIGGMMMIGLHYLVTELLMVIGSIITILAWAIIQVFKIIGPLSLAFSIMLLWKNQGMKWLNGYIGAYATMIVVLIFGAIQQGITYVMVEMTDEITSYTAVLAVDIVVIAMYLSAFRFGSYIVGDDVGSSVVTSGMQAITAAATAGGSMAAGAGVAAITGTDAIKQGAAGTLGGTLKDIGKDVVEGVKAKSLLKRD